MCLCSTDTAMFSNLSPLSAGMPERASASGGLSSLQHSSGGRNGTSFHGCLRNLYINGKLQDLAAGLELGTAGSGTALGTARQWLGQGVEPGCQPCQRGACVQGDCHPTGHRGFTCTCHPGWTGTLCDQQVNNPCDGNKWVFHSVHYVWVGSSNENCCWEICWSINIFPFPASPSSGVSTVPAFQSTPTPTRAAASLASLACSVTSRTRTQLTPAACLAANMESVECQAWARHTANVTVVTQGRRATEVRNTAAFSYLCHCKQTSHFIFFSSNHHVKLFKLSVLWLVSLGRPFKLRLCCLLTVCVSNSVSVCLH